MLVKSSTFLLDCKMCCRPTSPTRDASHSIVVCCSFLNPNCRSKDMGPSKDTKSSESVFQQAYKRRNSEKTEVVTKRFAYERTEPICLGRRKWSVEKLPSYATPSSVQQLYLKRTTPYRLVGLMFWYSYICYISSPYLPDSCKMWLPDLQHWITSQNERCWLATCQ